MSQGVFWNVCKPGKYFARLTWKERPKFPAFPGHHFLVTTFLVTTSDECVLAPELTIAPSFKFRLYPLRLRPLPRQLINLKTDVNESYFDEFIRCSYTLHLTGAHFKKLPITGNPRRDVYSYLAPKLCPITFAAHLTTFWTFCAVIALKLFLIDLNVFFQWNGA